MFHKGISYFINGLLNLIFPPVCTACDQMVENSQLETSVCSRCWLSLSEVGPNTCSKCGKPLASPEPGKAWHDFKCSTCRERSRIPYDLLRSLYRYQEPLPQIVQKMKFENQPAIARGLGKRLAEYASQWSFFRDCDLIVPVPISRLRYIKRGYNQSLLLAKEVGFRLNLPVSENILRKVRHNKPQWQVEFEQRKQNVRGAFSTTSALIDKKILLVDDIYTSGATMEECAKILKRAGAARVMALTLARARDA